MKKKRTVRKQFFKLMFALCATFALSIPIGLRAENEVKEKTDANIKGSVVDSKTQQPLSHASVLVVGTVKPPPPMPKGITR